MTAAEHDAFVRARRRVRRLHCLLGTWARIGDSVSIANLGTSVDDADDAYRLALHDRFPRVFPEVGWP